MTTQPDRLYIAVRNDLPPGLQMAQSTHAAFHYSHEHPEVMSKWLENSNYLVIVSVDDEKALLGLQMDAEGKNIVTTMVREPDLNDEATAIAFEPGESSRKLCGTMPLALKRESYLKDIIKQFWTLFPDPKTHEPKRYVSQELLLDIIKELGIT